MGEQDPGGIPAQVTDRQRKLADLRGAGRDPFRANCPQEHTSRQAISLYGGEDGRQTVHVAGRITVFRLMGRAAFVKILDRDGLIQLYFRRDELGDEAYADFRKLDLGDIIGCTGALFRTRTGEVTVRVQQYTLVSKALRPPPEKWHGLSDDERIYRQRYLDLISNEESRRRFQRRSRIVSTIRRVLDEDGFLEAETPVLHSEAGGAAARTFRTRLNALGCDYSLRIALELHLKRLLVGGLDRVYEIGRIFRNEGLSRRHNPEFTMLEVYQAYSDYRGMMDLLQRIVLACCDEVIASREIPQAATGEVITFGDTWAEARYKDLIVEATADPNWFGRPTREKVERCEAMGVQVDPELDDTGVTNDIFEKRIEPGLTQPTFVTHLPRGLVPLAKVSEDDPDTVEVFEFCAGGMELAPAYSEQNDPEAQRRAFEQQSGGEPQAADEDFLLALEHGMPPAGGMGLGIDRLVMCLTGASSVRETILFPTLRPLDSG